MGTRYYVGFTDNTSGRSPTLGANEAWWIYQTHGGDNTDPSVLANGVIVQQSAVQFLGAFLHGGWSGDNPPNEARMFGGLKVGSGDSFNLRLKLPGGMPAGQYRVTPIIGRDWSNRARTEVRDGPGGTLRQTFDVDAYALPSPYDSDGGANTDGVGYYQVSARPGVDGSGNPQLQQIAWNTAAAAFGGGSLPLDTSAGINTPPVQIDSGVIDLTLLGVGGPATLMGVYLEAVSTVATLALSAARIAVTCTAGGGGLTAAPLTATATGTVTALGVTQTSGASTLLAFGLSGTTPPATLTVAAKAGLAALAGGSARLLTISVTGTGATNGAQTANVALSVTGTRALAGTATSQTVTFDFGSSTGDLVLFASLDPNVCTVSPTNATTNGSPIAVTVTAVAAGATGIRATAGTGDALLTCDVLVDVFAASSLPILKWRQTLRGKA